MQMNDSMIPHLVVNRDYEALLVESKDENLCSYLRSNLASAKGLISDISARQSTLQRLICAVVACQRPFFTDGKSLQPMMMSEVAEALGVHVSTVSRAIAGKYIVCAAGTVSLKSLFTSGYASGGLSGAVSAAVIKRRLVGTGSRRRILPLRCRTTPCAGGLKEWESIFPAVPWRNTVRSRGSLPPSAERHVGLNAEQCFGIRKQ